MLTKTLSSTDQLNGSGNSNCKAAACFATQMRHKAKRMEKVKSFPACAAILLRCRVLSGAWWIVPEFLSFSI